MDSYSNPTDVLGNLRLMEQNEMGNSDAMYMDSASYETNHSSIFRQNNNSNYNSTYNNSNMNSYIGSNGLKMEDENNDSTDKINSPINASAKSNQQQPTDQAKSLDKSQLLTVVQFLKKYNFHNTEEVLLKETSNLLSEDDLKSEY